jgi:RNA polymerase sigma factor for flagellar operon FliA
VDESDLISYGLLGPYRALERFEPERNIKFETYAITRIKVRSWMSCAHWTGVPRSVRSMARQIEKCSASLENKLHRAPTDEEMAKDMGLTDEEFQEALTKIVQLDRLSNYGRSPAQSVALIDTIEDRQANPAEVVDINEVKERLASASQSPQREDRHRPLYYEGLTLGDRDVLGVTESRISQLHPGDPPPQGTSQDQWSRQRS